MSGQTSAALIKAMAQVKSGKATPYAAAKANNIAVSTMYRSALYKKWKAKQEPAPDPEPAT